MLKLVRRLLGGVRAFVVYGATRIPGGPWSSTPSGLFGREHELASRSGLGQRTGDERETNGRPSGDEARITLARGG